MLAAAVTRYVTDQVNETRDIDSVGILGPTLPKSGLQFFARSMFVLFVNYSECLS